MATKYDVLVSLIEAGNDRRECDERGIIAGVVGLISESHGSEEYLADAIYDLIAECYARVRADGGGVENQVDQT